MRTLVIAFMGVLLAGCATHDHTKAPLEPVPPTVFQVPVDTFLSGKPFWAHGLWIDPVPPRSPGWIVFPPLLFFPATREQLAKAPYDSVKAELRFGRDGTVACVDLLHNKGRLNPGASSWGRFSGNFFIDLVIVGSLAKWRATGQHLKALEEDETVNVVFRIFLR